jgi:hypothetical protein
MSRKLTNTLEEALEDFTDAVEDPSRIFGATERTAADAAQAPAAAQAGAAAAALNLEDDGARRQRTKPARTHPAPRSPAENDGHVGDNADPAHPAAAGADKPAAD